MNYVLSGQSTPSCQGNKEVEACYLGSRLDKMDRGWKGPFDNWRDGTLLWSGR